MGVEEPDMMVVFFFCNGDFKFKVELKKNVNGFEVTIYLNVSVKSHKLNIMSYHFFKTNLQQPEVVVIVLRTNRRITRR